jgi:hypothetical protein
MRKQLLSAVAALTLAAGLVPASPAAAGTAPRDPDLNGRVPLGPVADAPLGTSGNWVDHFDLYAADSQIHGVGGWTGWGNTVVNGAFVRDDFSRTAPHSIEIAPTTDLVQEYEGYTSGTWTLTAFQYIPAAFAGQHYFLLLNTYVGATPTTCPTCNWSVQVLFDSASGTLGPDFGPCAGSTASFVTDQWVPIRVVIDLDADNYDFFYNESLLYSCSWTDGGSGGGVLNIDALDLFGNTSSNVYYDDVSLSNLEFLDGFESGDTREWHFTQP